MGQTTSKWMRDDDGTPTAAAPAAAAPQATLPQRPLEAFACVNTLVTLRCMAFTTYLSSYAVVDRYFVVHTRTLSAQYGDGDEESGLMPGVGSEGGVSLLDITAYDTHDGALRAMRAHVSGSDPEYRLDKHTKSSLLHALAMCPPPPPEAYTSAAAAPLARDEVARTYKANEHARQYADVLRCLLGHHSSPSSSATGLPLPAAALNALVPVPTGSWMSRLTPCHTAAWYQNLVFLEHVGRYALDEWDTSATAEMQPLTHRTLEALPSYDHGQRHVTAPIAAVIKRLLYQSEERGDAMRTLVGDALGGLTAVATVVVQFVRSESPK